MAGTLDSHDASCRLVAAIGMGVVADCLALATGVCDAMGALVRP